MALRDYQKELYNKTVQAFRDGYRRPLIVLGCGGGKSYIFAEMIRNTRGEVLVLTHRQELKRQHEELLSTLGITNARVAMILTEANRLGTYPKPSLIVTDEAHLSRSNSWVKVIEYYDTYTVGFTATPVRLDGKPLGDIYDVLIEGVDTKWLIEHKRLAPYEYYAPTAVDTSGLRVVAGDYVVSDLERLMNERSIYGDILESYKRFADGERTIAYCVSVSRARAVAEVFRNAGYRAEAVSADTPTKERDRIFEDFKNGRITIMCNVGIVSEGISIDEVTCCMLLRPTESVALGVQQMMRCMRYLPGKTAKIVDCVGNYLQVGLPDDDREWSLNAPLRKRKQMDENGNFYIRCCPECYMTFKAAPVCPFCNHTYPLHPKEIATRTDIELKRITAEENAKLEELRKRNRVEQGKAQTYSELVALGRSRGYRNAGAWAAQVMRGRNRK